MSSSIGCLIIDVLGTTLTPEDREILNHPLIGGVIFFARHYENRTQLQSLCAEIKASRKLPLLLMVDQEGGRVQRFVEEFTKLPAMGQIGQLYDTDPERARQMATHCGYLMATEVLSLGIDLSLAPILDLNKNLNHVIGARAFHADPEVVIQLAQAFINGMAQAGMVATGKHFPGHGSVTTDSHTTTPIDERSYEQIVISDLIPFHYFIQHQVKALMTCHIVFPQIDSRPVTFSPTWIKDILKGRLGFEGIVFSDDLNMEGANISTYAPDRVQAAREAGCDLTFLCNNRPGVIQVLDQLPASPHQIPYAKWQALRAKNIAKTDAFQQTSQWQTARDYLLTIS